MSKSNEQTGKQVIGCFGVTWQLLVTTPMWLVLLFALMNSAEMPTWSWVLYWCYLPATLLGVGFAGLIKVLAD